MRYTEIHEADDRDIIQKILDLLNHETTEDTLKTIALQRLTKLVADAGKFIKNEDGFFSVIDKAERVGPETSGSEITTGPTILSGQFEDELQPEDFNNFWIHYAKWQDSWKKWHRGKKVTYAEVLSVLLPLKPLKIHFTRGGHNTVGGVHVDVWFDVDNEPDYATLKQAFKQHKLGKAGIVEKPKYDRLGKMFTARFFISFQKFGQD